MSGMSREYFDPAYTVIKKLGGLENAALASGASESWVSRWRVSKDRRGTGGLIPSKYHSRILEWARENKKSLRPSDFFGAPSRRAPENPKPSVPRSKEAPELAA